MGGTPTIPDKFKTQLAGGEKHRRNGNQNNLLNIGVCVP